MTPDNPIIPVMTATAIPDLIDTFIGFLSLEFIDRQKHQLE
jgi:hypothetical protein